MSVPASNPEPFFQSLRHAHLRALLLDYDGTLAPFRARRDEAFPYPGVREALQAIEEAGKTRVVIVTGRSVASLLPLLGLPRPPEIWGSHGLERRFRDGRYEAAPLDPATQRFVAEAQEHVRRLGGSGVFEAKPFGFALHRRADAETFERLRGETIDAWREEAAAVGLELLEFDGGVELRPVGRHKGEVVETILAEMGEHACAAYLGDDATDEDAFRAIEGQGLGVLVRAEPRASAAGLWIRPPKELLGFLARWRAEEDGGAPSEAGGSTPAATRGRSSINLIVVSNRLPFIASRDKEGRWAVEPGSGGLVTALKPVLQDRGGRWIGWVGATQEELPDATSVLKDSEERFGYQLVPVALTAPEKDGFYYGFANEVIWPLFHDLTSLSNFDPAYWVAYEAVNRKFAQTVAENAQPEDFIWAHDYHLMTMARELRELGVRSRMAFFLHIPFPSLDIFLKLPWRFGVLRSLLEYDLIGFQTVRDRRNFLECVRLLLPDAEIAGRGDVRRVGLGGREIRVGTFPISIDVGAFERRAAEKEVVAKARELRADEPDRKILLGIDRLDYTKGIPQKLEAFRSLLTRFPRLRERATLFQVVVPSREDIPRYRDHKRMIERLVGQINGQFTRSGWVPIHYLYRALDGPRLPAYYLAADVAVVTPLKDGMNLVAKEYCATHSDERGTLVLSEFAGAAAQLQRGALLVNPYDTEGMAGILERALSLSPEEQRSRMHRLRRSVKEYDIYRWVDHFLDAAISRDLSDFPRLEEYIPEATAS